MFARYKNSNALLCSQSLYHVSTKCSTKALKIKAISEFGNVFLENDYQVYTHVFFNVNFFHENFRNFMIF